MEKFSNIDQVKYIVDPEIDQNKIQSFDTYQFYYLFYISLKRHCKFIQCNSSTKYILELQFSFSNKCKNLTKVRRYALETKHLPK